MLMNLPPLRTTTRAYDDCGFQSRALSHEPNEIKKTKLDNSTSPVDGIRAMWAAAHITEFFVGN